VGHTDRCVSWHGYLSPPGAATSLYWSSQFLGQVMMWLASLMAVILVYLSIVYGSRLAVGRVDAVETTLLIFVTLAECSLFVSVALGSGASAAHRQNISQRRHLHCTSGLLSVMRAWICYYSCARSCMSSRGRSLLPEMY
jgi:hypothetical protein